jgi:hypothetical protein
MKWRTILHLLLTYHTLLTMHSVKSFLVSRLVYDSIHRLNSVSSSGLRGLSDPFKRVKKTAVVSSPLFYYYYYYYYR